LPQGKLATGDDTSTNDEDFSSIPADAKLNACRPVIHKMKKGQKTFLAFTYFNIL